ncbi:histidinol-phosphate transaminase [Bifidobacterium jacchi]|uniref:Histidinol-phosphate aminotransferase n=1 Tax=Bifidobacterium jacchi TaxID=2490545 RepID=A0A5N5RIH7_9BIFI|nr:histidinol-phosphate transaminase [Bifidobacterium jacchi]KAB5607085.1 histidinol-phosphate transaminase [Bifidobacterium jacchi]
MTEANEANGTAAAETIAAFRHRDDLAAIPVYRQGKPAPAGRRAFKLSSNENPYGPLPSVVKAIDAAALTTMNRYPDMHGWKVVERLAKRYDVDPASIILGAGSSEVITMLVDALSGPGTEVIYPWRSFEAYPIIVRGAGATPVEVPLTADLRHDIPAMIAAITDRTRLIIVNNPNNPTSTTVSRAEAEQLMRAVPKDVVVLFDEAYYQFNTDADTEVATELMREYPNIVIARTFSKAYGLAGLRIGFGIGPVPVINEMSKVALPFSVSDVAQTAAVASLDAQDELDARVKDLIAERDRVTDALAEQGWHVPPSGANFFWLQLNDLTDQVAERLTEAGVIARVFSGDGIRISVGTHEANDLVIETCAAIIRDLPAAAEQWGAR